MRLLPQVCFGPSAEIACWQKGNAANPTACISPSGMNLDALLQAVGLKLAA
jgi:hypothetical protein